MQLSAENKFNPYDPLNAESQLSDNESKLMHKAREFTQQVLMPKIIEDNRNEFLDPTIIKSLGEHGFLGGSISKKYGCPEHNAIEYGLIAREIERCCSGYRSAFSVISGLVMHAIATFGDEQQKQQYLPEFAKGNLIGSFGLTEPDHGSDPGGMETTAHKTNDGYILNGKKKWIGMASDADVIIIWAKDDEGIIRGFILPKDTPGVTIKNTPGKLALRTVPSGEVHMQDAKLSLNALLPQSKGLRSPFSCLNNARYGIAWGALGAGEECFKIAREYTLNRNQFDKPLAANQLIQQKLVDMNTKLALALQACIQVGRCVDNKTACPEMISFVKRNSAGRALEVARTARECLGANGILDENHIMRHMANLEVVNTYEGTYDIHTLILGRAITGIQTFT